MALLCAQLGRFDQANNYLEEVGVLSLRVKIRLNVSYRRLWLHKLI